MFYVALLRGINVGGKNKVDMGLLKTAFEELGYENVVTYINSGNIIFESGNSDKNLIEDIESMLVDKFDVKVPVVLRSREDINNLCSKIPRDWTNDNEQKTDVLFLWPEVDNSNVLKKIRMNKDVDIVKYLSGAIVWNTKRSDVSKSGLILLVKNDLYKKVTVRNINTVRKIQNLM